MPKVGTETSNEISISLFRYPDCCCEICEYSLYAHWISVAHVNKIAATRVGCRNLRIWQTSLEAGISAGAARRDIPVCVVRTRTQVLRNARALNMRTMATRVAALGGGPGKHARYWTLTALTAASARSFRASFCPWSRRKSKGGARGDRSPLRSEPIATIVRRGNVATP